MARLLCCRRFCGCCVVLVFVSARCCSFCWWCVSLSLSFGSPLVHFWCHVDAQVASIRLPWNFFVFSQALTSRAQQDAPTMPNPAFPKRPTPLKHPYLSSNHFTRLSCVLVKATRGLRFPSCRVKAAGRRRQSVSRDASTVSPKAPCPCVALPVPVQYKAVLRVIIIRCDTILR